MTPAPVFIHSLFRAGSTYLFQVFRHSASGCFCYQEPLHELAWRAQEDPCLLLAGDDEEKLALLRHPKLGRSYFLELHDVWPAWKDTLAQGAVYDAYFAPPDADIGIPFWRALIQAAPGRPVFQECRTSGRIGAIKEQLGGFHLYLWRNPWDQWWSYKAAPYFDAANRLVLDAANPPPALLPLRELLPRLAGRDGGILDAFARYEASPLSSADSYLLFYLLWCLGLKEGLRHADLLVNIDQLSDSPACREETVARLAGAGIDGLDFSGCQTPQGLYLARDRSFLVPLETRAHEWLLSGGWSQEDLARLLALRRENEPLAWSAPGAEDQPQAAQASRMRELVQRTGDRLSRALSPRDGLAAVSWELDDTHQRLASAAGELDATHHRLGAALRELDDTHHRLGAALQELDDTHARLAAANQELDVTHQRLGAALGELRDTHQRLGAAIQEREALGLQLEGTRQELTAALRERDAMHQAAHEFHVLADAHAREAAELRASLSWRITRPLRLLSAPFMGGGRPLAARCVQWAMARPGLVAFIHACVDAIPPLRAAITRRVARALDEPDCPAIPVPAQDPEGSGLAPHARRVHAALVSALDRRHKERNP